MQLYFLIGVLIFGCCTAYHNYVPPGSGAPCSPPPGYVRRTCRTLRKLSETSEVLPAIIYGCVYVYMYINISNNDKCFNRNARLIRPAFNSIYLQLCTVEKSVKFYSNYFITIFL